MPLRDHFHPPLSTLRPWEGFHSAWANAIATELNRILPAEYVALPQVSRGSAVEIDVATLELSAVSEERGFGDWSPGEPLWSRPVDWSGRDLFEVRVIDQRDSPRLAGAIELVSPANKDRDSSRAAFAGKCAGYLRQGIGLVVVDVVTVRRHNLHQELVSLLELDAPDSGAASDLYTVAYRTISDQPSRLDVWPFDLAIGAQLPTLPLWLSPDLAVPVELEVSYSQTCRNLRIE